MPLRPPGGQPRPIDGLLSSFAAGHLGPYLHALVTAHLMLSDENRALMRELEAKAGEELDSPDAPAAPMRASRDHMLSAIYAGGYYGRPAPVARDPETPEPIARLIGLRLDDAPWRRTGEGVAEHLVHEGQGERALLLKADAGRPIAFEAGQGVGAVLVLRGALSDGEARYRRGDVAIAAPALGRSAKADPAGACICFAVANIPAAPPPRSFIEKLFRR